MYNMHGADAYAEAPCRILNDPADMGPVLEGIIRDEEVEDLADRFIYRDVHMSEHRRKVPVRLVRTAIVGRFLRHGA